MPNNLVKDLSSKSKIKIINFIQMPIFYFF